MRNRMLTMHSTSLGVTLTRRRAKTLLLRSTRVRRLLRKKLKIMHSTSQTVRLRQIRKKAKRIHLALITQRRQRKKFPRSMQFQRNPVGKMMTKTLSNSTTMERPPLSLPAIQHRRIPSQVRTHRKIRHHSVSGILLRDNLIPNLIAQIRLLLATARTKEIKGRHLVRIHLLTKVSRETTTPLSQVVAAPSMGQNQMKATTRLVAAAGIGLAAPMSLARPIQVASAVAASMLSRARHKTISQLKETLSKMAGV
mmetsp:Transcript_4507/g.10619  ORF Transcript_4507/g.10619 Transcript_4507/m.10619 type:complete len:253 (-) Transcript_4507:315-1073(-)